MKRINIRNLTIAFLVALILTVSVEAVGFEAKCDDLRNNILRLHILANSDSEQDQLLKLKVRDAIISADIVNFNECTNVTQAISIANSNIEKITDVAKKVINDNGYNYEVTATVDKSYFNTREYDNFTLPAGIYDALIIKIGSAEGKNWWCVMFPALCLPSASDASLTDCVSDDSAEIAVEPQKYQIRFKTVEIYQHIKKILSKQ